MHDSTHMTPRRRRSVVASRLRRRLIEHIAAGGTTDMADRPMENSASAYVSVEQTEREKQVLFRRLPLLVGLTGDVPMPGDILVFEDAGPSIIIVRGRDARLRAFLNTCTHRGSKIVQAQANGMAHRETRLTCPFHAWSFDLEGRLVSIPGREGFEQIDLSCRNLMRVEVDEWHGLIFIRLESDGSGLETEAYLGDFSSDIAYLELGALKVVRHGRLNADTDWKLALDTYCEAYHFGRLHQSTIGTSHHSNTAVFDNFAPHWRLAFAPRSLDALVGKPESEWPPAEFSCVHFLFPNTILVVGELGDGEMCVRAFRLFPGRQPGTMCCEIGVYASPSVVDDPQRLEQDFAYDDATSDITLEDYEVAELAYLNLLEAPDNFTLAYGRNEPALQAFHRAVANAVALGETSTG